MNNDHEEQQIHHDRVPDADQQPADIDHQLRHTQVSTAPARRQNRSNQQMVVHNWGRTLLAVVIAVLAAFLWSQPHVRSYFLPTPVAQSGVNWNIEKYSASRMPAGSILRFCGYLPFNSNYVASMHSQKDCVPMFLWVQTDGRLVVYRYNNITSVILAF